MKLKPLLLKFTCLRLSGCWSNPNFLNLPVHLNAIDKAVEFYSKTYKILIAGDFNACDIKLDTYCSIQSLKSLKKDPLNTLTILLEYIYF